MTASHPRRMAAVAASLIAAVGALAACDGSTSSSNSSSPTTGTTATATCEAGATCSTTPVTVGETTLTVTGTASRKEQTLSAELVAGGTLHCPGFTSSGGALAVFSSTAKDAPKTVTYALTGTAAQALEQAYAAHPTYLGCYGSPHKFIGSVDGHRGAAVFVDQDELYEAALLSCESVDTKPCFRYAANGNSVTLTVEAPAGDPKIIL